MRFTEKLAYPIKNSPFYCRPLALICGLFLCALFFTTVSVWLTAVFLFAFAGYVVYRISSDSVMKKGRNPLPYLMITAVLLGCAATIPNALNYKKLKSLSEEEHTFKCVITENVYSEAFGELYKAKIISVDGSECSGSAYVTFNEQVSLLNYDTVTITALPTDARKDASGSELWTVKAENICLELEAYAIISVTNESKNGVGYLIYRLREAMGKRLDGALNAQTSAYAKALLIGEKSGLDDSFRRDMSALGVSHILAVSGMHMSIIAGMVTFFTERMKTRRKLKSLMIIAGAAAFCGIAGFSPSVVRAAIMLMLGVLPTFFGGRGDSITALFFAGALICASSPETVISCSFLLSFSATLGIVTCASYVSGKSLRKWNSSPAGDMKALHKILKTAFLAISVSLSASLFTVPALSMYFNETSFFAVIMNVVAVPTAFVSMSLTIAVITLADIPVLGYLAVSSLQGIYAFLKWLAAELTGRISVTVSLSYPFFFAILALLFVTLLFLRLRGTRNPLALLGVFVACAAAFAICVQIYGFVYRDRAEIVYVTNKTSEGIVVNSGSETLFIDIGNGSKSVPTEAMDIASSEYCETGIDGFMLTHYHSNHISTLKRFMRTYRIKTLYLPYPETEKDKSFYNSILPYTNDVKTVMYYRGHPIFVGKAMIETSEQSLLERSEHPVMLMNIRFGDRAVTYLGSSVTESELAPTAERFLSESGTVICGRHGPVTKESYKFYLFRAGTQVVLSPYEDTDETVVFEGGKYRYLGADKDGFGYFRLIFS
ncbi:MAG: ComEC/Rec2 family competence protein [Ruminococcaceae bacterium]|nr:ComEC/Rec2 family competence protein [Oscillospiraceae bacterium]